MAINQRRSLAVKFICMTIIAAASSNKGAEDSFLYLTVEPTDQTILINLAREVNFPCTVEGSPTPEITWMHNGQNITNDGQYQIHENGALTIRELNKQNDGDTFICIVGNDFGKIISNNATLSIAYIDELSITSQLIIVEEQESSGVCLDCHPPDAHPGISAIWTVGTMGNVPQDERRVIMGDGRLCFAYLEKSDAGEYQCSVASSFDNEGALFLTYKRNPIRSRLSVTDGNTPQSLSKVDLPQSITVKRGQIATMECFFFGRPAPSLSWTKTGAELPTKVIGQTGERLIIPDAQPEDSGEYTCTGKKDGNTDTANTLLTVISPPILTTELDSDTTVRKLSDVNLRCETNDQSDSYVWFYNAEPIIPTDHLQQQGENALLIKRVMPSDDGIYQCQVTNQHGSTLSTTQLKVKETLPGDLNSSEARRAAVSLLVASIITALIHRLVQA
ncbi:contactin-5-like isoform X3 [Apostichopus japonicus]|uniref:contactin-5-like isoform X3 n=1 Tax=Stichopus japonicus TaxID=307972 RepID=UPI003AB4C8A3